MPASQQQLVQLQPRYPHKACHVHSVPTGWTDHGYQVAHHMAKAAVMSAMRSSFVSRNSAVGPAGGAEAAGGPWTCFVTCAGFELGCGLRAGLLEPRFEFCVPPG